jgi:Zn-dependent peptidase ImmA (M78 family)
MAEPWKAAAALMREYYDSKGQEWVAFSASRLIERVKLARNRWADRTLRAEAAEIIRRAAFDVDDLVERHLGVDLEIESLRELDRVAGAQVFGLADTQRWTIAVCERAEAYEPLYRATVMHEIGHLLLHRFPSGRSVAYAPESRQRPPHEREADQFMHVALLPKSLLLLAIAHIADLWDIHPREAFSGANTDRGRWQWRERFLTPLVNNLVVSRQMICIKLLRVGIFSQETLEFHTSYTLRNRWLKHQRCGPLRRSIEEVVSRLV